LINESKSALFFFNHEVCVVPAAACYSAVCSDALSLCAAGEQFIHLSLIYPSILLCPSLHPSVLQRFPSTMLLAKQTFWIFPE